MAGQAAEAACSNPAGSAGDLIYNKDSNVPQFCNGSNWVIAGRSIRHNLSDSTYTTTEFASPDGSTIGSGMALSGNTLAFGAIQQNGSGSVYLYDISDPASPTLKAKLMPYDGSIGDDFGGTIALSGSTLIVGAPVYIAGTGGQGMVYLFDISDLSHPVFKSQILNSDNVGTDEFGTCLAVLGTTLAVSTLYSSSIYLYDISDPANPIPTSEYSIPGNASVTFGRPTSMAFWGVLLAVGSGACVDYSGFNYCGAGAVALIDVTDPSHPTQLSVMTPPAADKATNIWFGSGVSISGNTIIIGAPGASTDKGTAYFFDISNASSPVQKSKITASDGAAHDGFGGAVSSSGNSLLIGADPGTRMGRAYLYDISSPSSPVLSHEFFLTNGASHDSFGKSALIAGGTLVISSSASATGTLPSDLVQLDTSRCPSPTGYIGSVIYNGDYHVPQYCDGIGWVAMGLVPGAGGTGCSSPAGAEGAMIYNADHSVTQYCDGTFWKQLGQY